MSYQPPVVPGPAAYSAPAPAQPPRKGRALPILLGVLALLVVFVAGMIAYLVYQRSAAATPATATATASATIIPGAAFASVQKDCNASMPSYDIEDAGHTLNLLVGGDGGTDSDTLTCVFNGLGVPDAVREHVGSTRALDGQQTDSWPGYTARWTYHPDAGLRMTIRMA